MRIDVCFDRNIYCRTANKHTSSILVQTSTATGNEEGLVGYWNFEEGPDEGQVIDVSGNENHGIITGSTYIEEIPEQNCEILRICMKEEIQSVF